MKKKYDGFTLIEILTGVLIFSIVIIGGFKALSSVILGKVKLVQKTDMTKDMSYFSEKIFDEIKSGGTIDYEEYFNRRVVGVNTSSGHYNQQTGYGNFGYNGTPGTDTYGYSFYYCRSGSGTNMGTGGCYNNSNNNLSTSTNGELQRYGQYSFQFIDYNSNEDSDLGDEDLDGNIVGDQDDENLGLGPNAFTGGTNLKEIYLISGDGKKRTLIRWNWKLDPDPKNPGTCGSATTFSSGCLGNIEILKLDGKDYGFEHDKNSSGSGTFDGVIDTWIINDDFSPSGTEIIAGSNANNYRQPLFPDTISVTSFEAYLYPNTDIAYNWKNINSGNNINPYLRLKLTLEPSRKKRPSIKGEIPKFTINTTVNLTPYFTQ